MPDPLRKTVSATESPAFFNASPFVTRWMLFQKFRHNIEAAKEQDNRMSWGKRLQPLLLQAAAEDLKLEIHPNADDSYIRKGLLGCTRDARIICPDRGPGAIEAKAVFDYSVWMQKWGGGDRIPHEYEIQLQQQMLVGDGDGSPPYGWGVLSVWVCGEQRYYERKPVEKLWTQLDHEAWQFFDDVKRDNEPAPFGDPVESKLLLECFPTLAGSVLDLRLDGLDPIENEEEYKRREKLAQDVAMLTWHSESRLGHERAEKALKAKFLALAAGNASVLLPHGCNVTVKQQSRAGFTVKPTSFQVVTAYAPPDVPRGDIHGLDPL